MSMDWASEASKLDLHILKMPMVEDIKAELKGESKEEERPTELKTTNISAGLLAVSKDKLSARYTGSGFHEYDVGVIQANRPAPRNSFFYYFEVSIKNAGEASVNNAGEKGRIAIGFTREGFKMSRMPMWGEQGFFYHGNGKPFQASFTAEDIVGSGINTIQQSIFFTRNGRLVGKRVKRLRGPMFPTIALHSPNAEVHVNFGPEEFRFDMEGHKARTQEELAALYMRDRISPSTIHRLAQSYFLQNGYEETLKAFGLDCEKAAPQVGITENNVFEEQDLAYALNERKIVRLLVSNGEIDAALSKLQDLYPQDELSAVCFLLHCQKFIELIRAENLLEANTYGRYYLNKFLELERFESLAKDCFALLTFDKPLDSEVGYLLGDEWREVVADAVNTAILAANPNPEVKRDVPFHTDLETLFLQSDLCVKALGGGKAFIKRTESSLNP